MMLIRVLCLTSEKEWTLSCRAGAERLNWGRGTPSGQDFMSAAEIVPSQDLNERWGGWEFKQLQKNSGKDLKTASLWWS